MLNGWPPLFAVESVTFRRGPNDFYRGHRIRDSVTLERHRLHGDSLLLYQAKSGTPVYVLLAPHVVNEFENIPPGPKPIPAISFGAAMEIQRVPLPIGSEAIAVCTDRRISEQPTARESAVIPICSAIHSPWRCCSPEFPSTRVSLLFGHALVKITEKTYAPFVKARQVQLQKACATRGNWLNRQGPDRRANHRLFR